MSGANGMLVGIGFKRPIGPLERAVVLRVPRGREQLRDALTDHS